MKLLKPDLFFNKITDIDMEVLKQMQIEAVFLDVDNTLCPYHSKEPIKGAIKWVRRVEREGYKVFIVSNNYKKRVEKVARTFGLPFVSMALKPLPIGFNKAAKNINLKKNKCVIIGDQVFTDVLGANLAGMKSILVEPIELEKGISIGVRRHFEKPLKTKFTKN